MTTLPRRCASQSSLLERRQDLAAEPLQLRQLVLAAEPDAQVGNTSLLVLLERRDDGVRRPEPHAPTILQRTAAAVVGRQILIREALRRRDVIVKADRRVDAEREVRVRPP